MDLVTENIGYVVTLARQYKSDILTTDDLVSEGVIGMMKAAEKYVSDTGQSDEVFADVRRDVDDSLALSETLAVERGIPPFAPEPIPLAERQDAPSIFELPHETDIVRRAASGFRPERDLE